MTQFTAYQKKQLGLFAMLTLAFLSLFTVLYARNRDNTLLSLLMLTPALSALIVNRLTHERRSLFLRPKFKRNLSRYALSWFLPPLLAFAGAGLYFLIFPSQFQPLASRFAVNNGLAEPGAYGRQLLPVVRLRFSSTLRRTDSGVGQRNWRRGWLLPRLRDVLGTRKSVVVTALIWGLWHAPIILLGYNYGTDHPLLGVLMQLWLCLIQGIILAWLQFRSESVWTCALWHASLNGIDRYAASALLSAGSVMPLVGPDLTGLIGGLGFVLAAVLCWRGICQLPKRSSTAKSDAFLNSDLSLIQ